MSILCCHYMYLYSFGYGQNQPNTLINYITAAQLLLADRLT